MFSSIILTSDSTGGIGMAVRSASNLRASSLIRVFTFIFTAPLGGYKPALSINAIVNYDLTLYGTLSEFIISTALSNSDGNAYSSRSLVRYIVLPKYSFTLSIPKY